MCPCIDGKILRDMEGKEVASGAVFSMPAHIGEGVFILHLAVKASWAEVQRTNHLLDSSPFLLFLELFLML
jgi:hypothetical protein